MPPLNSGVDASRNCASIAGQLQASGRKFICRYYANSGKKRLTADEAKILSAAGLTIVVVWEDGFPTKAAYFSRAKGVDDGTSAYHDALSLSQPKGSAIYFAVDFDAPSTDIAAVISEYFRGIADGFSTISQGNPNYRIGVYGSGSTCSSLLNQNLATYSWMAMSKGWQGHDCANWNIKQKPGKSLNGVSLDYDDAADDYGGFVL